MAETAWRNRIVEHGEADPRELIKHLNPLNYRTHPREQSEALRGALEDVGWIQQIILNKTTGNLIDGHHRVVMAVDENQPLVPVEYVELTENEERLALAFFDPITNMADVDPEKLRELLGITNTGNASLQEMMSNLAEQHGVVALSGEGSSDSDEIEEDEPPDPTEELREKWGTEIGQVWELGKHRIYCGDCTDKSIVSSIIDSDIKLIFTSPPYLHQRTYNDNMSLDWDSLVLGAFQHEFGADTQILVNLGLVHRENRVVRYWDGWIDDMEAKGWRFFGWYVWDKIFGFPGEWNGRLAPAHEFIFHFNKKNGMLNKIVGTNQAGRNKTPGNRQYDGSIKNGNEVIINSFKIPDSVIRISKEQSRGIHTENHPAVFPVALPIFIIEAYTSDAEYVYDPFLGSGTTLIACEQTGRIARCCEIDPGYTAVCLQRWSDLTGETPKLL